MNPKAENVRYFLGNHCNNSPPQIPFYHRYKRIINPDYLEYQGNITRSWIIETSWNLWNNISEELLGCESFYPPRGVIIT